MFVEVFSYQSDPSQVEAHVEFVKHVVMPDNHKLPGFKGLQMLVDRQTGRSLGITYWANEADARAAAEQSANPPQPPAGVDAPAISDITIEVYEVLIELPAA
jgi:heme-degrading monooxygenase HmoA